jgi:thiol-disulfide isomerase/thioredoxin
MKHLVLFFLLTYAVNGLSQTITMTKVIDGKKYVVTQKSRVYDTAGTLLPFEKWFSMVSTHDLVPLPAAADSLQEYQIRPLSAADLASRNAEIEKRKAAINTNRIMPGTSFSEFTATDINGKKWSLGELSGKIIVINYWFVDCAPCVKEIPELNELQKDYRKNPNIIFLAITPVDDAERLNSFLQKKPFNFTHFAKDQANSIKETKGIASFPTYLIIDKNGNISYYASGYSDASIHNLRTKIEKLIVE